MTKFYDISDAQFKEIENTISVEFKTVDYQTEILKNETSIPEEPDGEFLKQFDKNQRKHIKNVAKNYDAIKVFVAVKSGSKNVANTFTFMKNRANQQWTYSAKVVKSGMSKVSSKFINTNLVIIGIGTFVMNSMFIPFLLTAGGFKYLKSSEIREVSKKVKKIFE